MVIVQTQSLNDQRELKLLSWHQRNTLCTPQGEFTQILDAKRIIYQRIMRNAFGVCQQDIYVFFAGDKKQQLPGVWPAVELLLFAKGKTQSKKLKILLEQLSTQGGDLDALSDNYWIRQNARLATREELILPWNEKYFHKK